MNYFTRGGQIFIHQVLMWTQVVMKLTVFFLLLYVALVVGTFWHKTSHFEHSLAWQYWLTQSFSSNHAMVVVEWYQGNTYSLRADEFLANQSVQYVVKGVKHKFVIQVRKIAIWMVGLYFVAICLLILKGFTQSRRKFLRGSKLISPEALTRHLQLRFKASRITLGGVPLVKETRRKHILLIGATGSGKTQGILELLKGFRDEGYKVIILDPECTAVKYFYRNTHDIIINPMDARAKPWHFWSDARNESQLEYIAASLVPEPKSGADPFWHQAARVLFLETAKVVMRERSKYQGDVNGKPGVKRLLSLLTTANLKVLEEALKGTVAESLVSSDAEKLALSVKSTLSAYMRCLELLEDKDLGFSIREWVHDKNDAWLFITSREDMHETFKPLLSVILDVVSNELLTLDENPSRKIAVVIDEEASLNPSRSLQEVRARGSKRGIQVISGYQTTAQAVALSNSASAQALSSMYGTRVYFMCNDADSARQASRDLGQQEIIENNEQISFGANTIRDGVSLSQQRRVVDLVMPEQIMNLKPLNAYLRLSGNYPITQIKVAISPFNPIADGFVTKHLAIPTTELLKKDKDQGPTHDNKENIETVPENNSDHTATPLNQNEKEKRIERFSTSKANIDRGK
ncbi:MAG: type IV secretion system DNA-binding domain-containing protein [Legionellales bacterium]|jgi:type IV conjugative transfer system coupling protein TraD